MKSTFLAALAFSLASTHAFALAQFPTPEQAADALTQAISTHDEAALNHLLGDDWRRILPPEGADPEAVSRFLRDWKASHRVVQQGDTAHLQVGEQNWQLPIPVVKHDQSWQFDMQGAADEIVTRTIGRNELAAIAALHAAVDAQQSYYALNQRYAEKIVSSEGKKDGLYWPVQPGEAPSPLGPAFSPQQQDMGYHGYHFRLLPTHDNGFAMLAWPVSYGETGVMSFIVKQDDRVLEANLGTDTAQRVSTIDPAHLDKTWHLVAP
ncbi:DUF2950 family protein [Cronobacter malonaticus]|uniref:DUF2950 family protein n=1 Tax=Cronobacter malonaticus TaxID=413503 RepID=UPI000CFB25C4|nr:DUF2950 family protein [Cronobacter malonaticus]EKY3231325.1 DUF2950 family protein [Cronobacter malonaticus]ELY4024206.1 DUF2950 family protein [Cronobacter malonaticus]MDI7685261.1 DUF2950 family protein [Cronobacter malonaticus]